MSLARLGARAAHKINKDIDNESDQEKFFCLRQIGIVFYVRWSTDDRFRLNNTGYAQ